MKFYEKLQMLRKEKGISQEALAETLGVSRQAISKWESGAAYPETEKMISLCETFGVTLDSLIRDGELRGDGQSATSEPPFLGYRREYEYKSKRILFGMPLVHINVGRGLRKAKGVVAVGNIATGFLSLGLVSAGVLSLGLASAGLVSFGVLSLGALFSMGAFSVGTFSFGAIALGYVAVGAVSAGVYSMGALSAASRVAVGDRAYGAIAVGRVAEGMRTFIDTSANRDFSTVPVKEVRDAIKHEFPNTWRSIISLLTFWGV